MLHNIWHYIVLQYIRCLKHGNGAAKGDKTRFCAQFLIRKCVPNSFFALKSVKTTIVLVANP